ncbi:mannitol dehydrogenase family protein [Polycladidibacter stylochi]|uniref:mannitol dehydrogenase family protein n=1 Tax=Polycladidibacter stylochi TaxID=1807766 RepID=UPI00082C6907|nr:D-mannonate oxidoreductase [Pseudovibrio stylochi]
MTSLATQALPSQILQTTYDRSELKTRIVHLGFGAFHRGHMALYNELTNETAADKWGICEVNLVGGEDAIEALRQQDHLYTVTEKSDSSLSTRLIRCVTSSLHPTMDGMQAVLEAMCDEDIRIVSLTITEKGYCSDASGELNFNNPFIQGDLEDPQNPKSALGVIVEALRLRRERGLAPFSVLSCDNIPENGHLIGNCVKALSNRIDAELGAWIAQNVSFPSTMVDRIVPAMTPESHAEVTAILGFEDPCGIVCEPFRQWVVEDNFVKGRPQWEQADAMLVGDVLPYEEMKLRMLNGTHSFLAYSGFMAGHETISDCMADEVFAKAARKLMLEEQAPTLRVPDDLEKYADLLLGRFANTSIRHRTWQIAMDGSQKLPQRALDSIRFHISKGNSFVCLATSVAAWMTYVQGKDSKGEANEVVDPLLPEIQSALEGKKTNDEVVDALLSINKIFYPELVAQAVFVDAVKSAYGSIAERGSRAHVQSLIAGE